MDRRTHDSKLVRNAVVEGMRAAAAKMAVSEYIRAQRCRICGLDERELPNASHVRQVIDRELMNNSTYKAALPLVARWEGRMSRSQAEMGRAERMLGRCIPHVGTIRRTCSAACLTCARGQTA